VKMVLAALAALLAGWIAAPARAETIGVIIVATDGGDSVLADNLTEVAMARVADTPGRQVAGTAELRRRLGVESARQVTSCLDRQACLARVAVSLGVSRLITGAIRAESRRYFLNLALTGLAPGQGPPPIFRQVDGSLGELIRATQQGVDQLLDPRQIPGQLLVRSRPQGARVTVDDLVVGTTPIVSGALPPGPHRVRVEADRRFAWQSVIQVEPGRQLGLDLGERELPRRRLWAPYVAYGAAGAAVLSAGAGTVLGLLARGAPVGSTREQAQLDLDRRTTYGHMGTGLLASAAVLGAVSAVVFWRCWPDIVAD
jgi:hypothetical protein